MPSGLERAELTLRLFEEYQKNPADENAVRLTAEQIDFIDRMNFIAKRCIMAGRYCVAVTEAIAEHASEIKNRLFTHL
jgi:hypothetical protein